jgi:exonuclease III
MGKYYYATGSDRYAGAAIIYSKELGEIEYQETCKVFKESGRPVHMLYTTKNFLIVNAHFPHAKGDKNLLAKYYEALTCHIARFTQNKIKKYSAIYIVGDFNLNTSNTKNEPFILRHPHFSKEIKLSYSGSLPRRS